MTHYTKLALLSLLASSSIMAQDIPPWTLGAISTTNSSVHLDTDDETEIWPLVVYQGEHLYFQGIELGYRLLPLQSFQNISIGLSLENENYNPDDSDDSDMHKLDDRDLTLMTVAAYRIGPVTFKAGQDIIGEHDGFFGEVTAKLRLKVNDIGVSPAISYRYLDEKLSNHIYGVSQAESDRTSGNIAAYDSGSTQKISYSLAMNYPVTQSCLLNFNLAPSRYNDISDSPIVEDDKSNSATFGAFVRF
jgi:outer membrane protein